MENISPSEYGLSKVYSSEISQEKSSAKVYSGKLLKAH